MEDAQSWRIGSILRKGISNYLQKKKKERKYRIKEFITLNETGSLKEMALDCSWEQEEKTTW